MIIKLKRKVNGVWSDLDSSDVCGRMLEDVLISFSGKEVVFRLERGTDLLFLIGQPQYGSALRKKYPHAIILTLEEGVEFIEKHSPDFLKEVCPQIVSDVFTDSHIVSIEGVRDENN